MISVYFDHNMPPHIAEGFQIIQKPEGIKNNLPVIEVKHFNDVLGPSVSDIEWFKQFAKTNSFVITKDYKISSRKEELEAYKKAGLGIFILRGTTRKENITVWQTLLILSKHWEEMVRIIQVEKRPFMYVISANRTPKPYK